MAMRISSFAALNVTQFEGALNDNLFKLLLVFFAIDQLGVAAAPGILATAGALFVAPFLLFSAAAGTFADRHSKRSLIVLAKVIELLVVSAGVVCFYFESVWGGYLVLFLMGLHSTLFSPCKYAILPEIVNPSRLSHANGVLASFTYLAIIVGTVMASGLTDWLAPRYALAALACVGWSLIGLLAALRIAPTPGAHSTHEPHPFFLIEIAQTLRHASRTPLLLWSMIGSAYFLFAGAYTQLNMIPYALEGLHLDQVKGGYLFMMTAIGIGLGALLAGRLCRKGPELGLSAASALLMACVLLLLALLTFSLPLSILLIVLLGVFGGLYVVPLDTTIQMASQLESRGRNIAASTFISFVGVLLASLMISLVSGPPGFAILALITGLFFFLLSYALRDRISSHLARILLGRPRLAKQPPADALLICDPSSAWPLIAALRQPVAILSTGSSSRLLHFAFPHIAVDQLSQALLRRQIPILLTNDPTLPVPTGVIAYQCYFRNQRWTMDRIA
jgi:acyl-[acyl-carrier-protein]-phospholipid O-acyltransferase / long-chain-fatty-acid--[acyl-carrier-protein] ligase